MFIYHNRGYNLRNDRKHTSPNKKINFHKLKSINIIAYFFEMFVLLGPTRCRSWLSPHQHMQIHLAHERNKSALQQNGQRAFGKRPTGTAIRNAKVGWFLLFVIISYLGKKKLHPFIVFFLLIVLWRKMQEISLLLIDISLKIT